MKEYVSINQERGDAVDWADVLGFDGCEKITSIRVFDNEKKSQELACATWGWNLKDSELEFHKIEVKEESQFGIGTTIMKIVFAIARFYKAPRITGTISGEKYLWNWYAKLGFTIHSYNKLLMELDKTQ
jgi:hypothetical protein